MKLKRAFSLSEVMIAVVVIAVGIIPVFFLFSRGNAGTVQTKDEILAYQFASELLAYAQTKTYDDPLLAVGRKKQGDISLTPLNGAPLVLNMDTDFDRYLSVVEIKPDVSLDWPFAYKVLTSEVSWKSGGVSRKIQLSVMIYQKNT